MKNIFNIFLLVLCYSCYSKESVREQTISLYEKGKQWEDASQADSAAKYYLRSFELAKKLKEVSLIGEVGNALGDILNMQSLYNNALRIHQEAYLFNIELEDKTAASHSLRGIGKDYLLNVSEDSVIYYTRLDSALVYFNKSKSLIS